MEEVLGWSQGTLSPEARSSPQRHVQRPGLVRRETGFGGEEDTQVCRETESTGPGAPPEMLGTVTICGGRGVREHRPVLARGSRPPGSWGSTPAAEGPAKAELPPPLVPQ